MCVTRKLLMYQKHSSLPHPIKVYFYHLWWIKMCIYINYEFAGGWTQIWGRSREERDRERGMEMEREERVERSSYRNPSPTLSYYWRSLCFSFSASAHPQPLGLLQWYFCWTACCSVCSPSCVLLHNLYLGCQAMLQFQQSYLTHYIDSAFLSESPLNCSSWLQVSAWSGTHVLVPVLCISCWCHRTFTSMRFVPRTQTVTVGPNRAGILFLLGCQIWTSHWCTSDSCWRLTCLTLTGCTWL